MKRNITLIVIIILAAIGYAIMVNAVQPDCAKLQTGDSAAQELYVQYCN